MIAVATTSGSGSGDDSMIRVVVVGASPSPFAWLLPGDLDSARHGHGVNNGVPCTEVPNAVREARLTSETRDPPPGPRPDRRPIPTSLPPRVVRYEARGHMRSPVRYAVASCSPAVHSSFLTTRASITDAMRARATSAVPSCSSAVHSSFLTTRLPADRLSAPQFWIRPPAARPTIGERPRWRSASGKQVIEQQHRIGDVDHEVPIGVGCGKTFRHRGFREQPGENAGGVRDVDSRVRVAVTTNELSVAQIPSRREQLCARVAAPREVHIRAGGRPGR